MKKITNIIAATFLLSLGLVSCQKDNDIEVIQPFAGGYLGTEDCGSGPGGEYETLIYNTADKQQVFIDNIGNLNHVFVENPQEKFAVTIQDGKFTLPPTTHTFRVYETAALQTAAATASTTAGRPLDLRTSFTYTVTATGTISGKVLTMSYDISNSSTTRRRFTGGNVVDQPVVTGEFDGGCTFTGDKDARHH